MTNYENNKIYLDPSDSGVISNERLRIVELVRRWGGSNSDAVLDPAIRIFRVQGIEGFIGYRLGSCFVVFGDPICSPEDKPNLAQAFHKFAKKNGKEVVYIAASKAFSHWAIDNLCGGLIEFGKQLVVDPSCDPRKRTGDQGSLVRRKVKQAAKENVSVQEYLGNDPKLERDIEQVGVLWLQNRKGLQVHISNVFLLDDRKGKRWFYAKQGDRIVGTISLNLLQAHEGWLINHLMIIPGAPNGTSELLIVTALEALAKEGCKYATFGMIAASELGEMKGFSSLCQKVTRFVYNIVVKVLKLDGLTKFWGKFHPENEPAYLLFSRNRIGIKEVLSLKKSLNSSS